MRILLVLFLFLFSCASYAQQSTCVVLEPDKPISVVTDSKSYSCVVLRNPGKSTKLHYFSVNNGRYAPQVSYSVARGLSYRLIPSSEEKVRRAISTLDPRYDTSLVVQASPRLNSATAQPTVPHIVQFYLTYVNSVPHLMINTDALIKIPSKKSASKQVTSFYSDYPQDFDVSKTLDFAIMNSSTSGQAAGCSEGSKSPDNVPEQANLNRNISMAESIRKEMDSEADLTSEGFKYLWFYFQVRNGSPWDYKQQGAIYEEFGNYNYGATGMALGIPTNVLLRGAGWAQVRAGSSQKNFGHYLGGSPFGDDPRDQDWINRGIKYYQDVISKKSESERLNGGEDKKDDCNPKHNTVSGGGSSGGGGGGEGGGAGTPGIFRFPDGIPVCFNTQCTSVAIRDLP